MVAFNLHRAYAASLIFVLSVFIYSFSTFFLSALIYSSLCYVLG